MTKTIFKNVSREQALKLATNILNELNRLPTCENFVLTIETEGGMENVEITND